MLLAKNRMCLRKRFGALGEIQLRCVRWFTALTLTLTMVLPAHAYDKPSFDAQTFYPTSGNTGFLSVDSGLVNPHLVYGVGLHTNYANKPLGVQIANDGSGLGGHNLQLLRSRLDLDLTASLGLFNRVEIGLLLPMVRSWGSAEETMTLGGSTMTWSSARNYSVGDLRLYAKVQALRLDRKALKDIFALAFAVTATAPTAMQAPYVGERSATVTGTVMMSSQVHRLVRLALNLGYMYRNPIHLPGITIDDQLLYKLAIGVRLPSIASVAAEMIGELNGSTSAMHPWGLGGVDGNGGATSLQALSPLEAVVGARVIAVNHLMITTGIGLGVTSGFGAPLPRAFVGLAYVSDGKPQSVGLPAPRVEKKPVKDEVLDDAAAPVGDTKKDSDGDGLPDAYDVCPHHAEDKDGVADDDGCVDDDDGDGIVDSQDKCPKSAETYNGIEDGDGCADDTLVAALARVVDDKIVVDRGLAFEAGRAQLNQNARGVLDHVVSLLRFQPQLVRVRIVSHSSDEGSRKQNVLLTRRRADVIKKYLVAHGVAAERLETAGYGPDRPLLATGTAGARAAANERIEILIVTRQPLGTDTSLPVIELQF